MTSSNDRLAAIRHNVRQELQNDARHWDEIAGFKTITEQERAGAKERARLYHALDAWLKAGGDLPSAPTTLGKRLRCSGRLPGGG